VTRVIAAVNNFAAAGPLLATSAAFAAELGARVEAFHVTDDASEAALARAQRYGITLRQSSGDPIRAIVELAAADDVVMVAVGARLTGRHRGHVARSVADAIDKPVLLVPPEAPSPERLRTVIVAMEGTSRNARSLKIAIELADGSDLDLIVVHVDDENSIPNFSDQVAHETEAYATEFIARHLNRAPRVRMELRVGVPADEIIAVVERATADLLAIGWPQNAGAGRGAVAHEVLDRSHVPVLLVSLANPTAN
jgi:nucleotide-binding universal stress UspA family protein